jgi:hypothetical protein
MEIIRLSGYAIDYTSHPLSLLAPTHPFLPSSSALGESNLTSLCLCATRYDLPEKVAIAKQYLIPKARTEAGIAADKEEVPSSLGISEGTSHRILDPILLHSFS